MKANVIPEHETVPEMLRRTARLLRERAGAATSGPWAHMCLGSEGCLVHRAHGTIRERGRGRVARFGQKEWMADHADAEYVKGMHPGVGLALAELLEFHAAMIEWSAASAGLPVAVPHRMTPVPASRKDSRDATALSSGEHRDARYRGAAA